MYAIDCKFLLLNPFRSSLALTPRITDLNNDAIPPGTLAGGSYDVAAWVGRHTASVTRPHIDKVIAELRAKGVTEFAAAGFCFGGRWTVDLVLDVSWGNIERETGMVAQARLTLARHSQDVLKVAIVSHPSLLKVPDDFEAVNMHSIPFLWNTAVIDFAVRCRNVVASFSRSGADSGVADGSRGASHRGQGFLRRFELQTHM